MTGRHSYGQNVLAELLSGLRYARAPLAAGYLWLLGLWLSLAPHLDPTAQHNGVLHDLDRLAHAAGKTAVIIAVTVTAYLVGVVSTAANPLITQLGNPLAATPLRHLMPRAQNRRVDTTITALVHTRIEQRFLTDDTDDTTRADTTRHLRAAQLTAGPPLPPDLDADPDTVINHARANPALRARLLRGLLDTTGHQRDCLLDLRLTPVRLIGHDNDLHTAYDRHRAEHELRLGLVLPLTYLTAVLTIRASPWWASGLLAAAALLYLGVAAKIQATTVLTESIRARRIDLPTLRDLTTRPLPWREPTDARTHLAE